MNTFLHTNMKSILIGLMVSMASFLSPTVATGQTGFWTDEGNYDEGWPEGHIVNDVYEIRDARDLAAFARSVNGNSYSGKTINMVADIDLSAHYWKPIGYNSGSIHVFFGTFEGLQHTISNIHIDITPLEANSSDGKFLTVGLFTNNEGRIRNVNLHNILITGINTTSGYTIGGLVGSNEKSNGIGLIEGCSVSGTENMVNISLPEEHRTIRIGGICGHNTTYSSIKNCTNRIPIIYSPANGAGVYIGGIAGGGSGFIAGCHNEGNMTGQCSAIGGILGDDDESGADLFGTIENCTNQGNITNLRGASAGGIAGSGSHISRCSNSGAVSSFYKAAGIVGNMPIKYTSPITYCYNSGSVSVNLGISDNPDSSTSYCGGIVAGGGVYEISNCYNTGDLSIKPSTDAANTHTVYIGGIAASVGSYLTGASLLSNCYNTGNISVQAPYRCYAGGIIGDGSIGVVSSCYNTGKIDVRSNNSETVIARGIFEKATGCLSLAKDKSMPFIRVTGGIDSKVHRLTTSDYKCENNYANAPMLLQVGDQVSVATENIAHNDVNGANWQDTDNTGLPISNWPADAWEKSDNTILPQLKYADGTLMPDQPRLLKSDYATETPSDPSDATLKSLSYKIGQDGQEIAVPGFRPDSSRYQISYQPGQAGSNFYAVGESVNAEAKVTNGYGELGENFAMVDVTPAEGSDRRYSIFGVEAGDEDKYYLVLHLGEHLAFWIDGKEYRGDTVYKAVPEKAITGRLVPDKGYKLPDEFWHYDGGMAVFVPKGTEWYTNDGEIPLSMLWHCALTAFAQEGEETGPLPVGSKLTVEPFVYEVLSENRVKLLHPVRTTEIWTVASCEVPDSVTYEGYRYQVTKIAASALAGYTTLKSITLPEGLLSIGAFAFDDCGLTRLHLPASVTFIGDEEGDWDLFGYCPNLQAVTVADGSKTYSASDSILYNKDRSRLILCPPAYPHSEMRVPDEVKEIMPYAFAYGKNVACLTLPAGLEKIREFAFSSSALTKGNGYIRCLGEQPVTFEDTEFLLLLSSTQAEEEHLLLSNNGKYPCTLYVPAGAKAAYEAAFFWKNFPITEELPSSGEVTITGKDEIKVGEEATKIEDGVIGNDDLPTVLERISIDIRSSSSQTTTLTFKQVTVGDGQIVTEETTTTTEIKEETNVSITIEGENVLGKLVNNGIAELLTDSKDGSLSNTVVVNYNTFTSETKLVNKVEGTAPLDVTDPENKAVVAGSSTTLVASTMVESSFSLTFVWERWVDGHWETVEERKYENLLRSSADKQEDKLTVSAADAGLYRCRITNTVGDASTTLITAPAEVKLTSSGGDPTPPFTPDATYYDIVLPQVTGATINPAAGKHSVKEGDSFSFTLTLDAAYSQSKPEVKAGDEVLVADANGKYTIANVRGDLTITITGITLNNPTANAEIDQAVKVWAEGHTLYVYTAERETIRLYSFSGQLLKQVDNAGRIAITGLPEGNYLIRIGNRTWKIAL